MKINLFKIIILLTFTSLFLNSCGGGFFKRSDIKDNPVNVDERVKKNIQEGRGIRFGKGATRGGDFDFASSNPLWRASIEIFDFVPLTNASYSGGIIITDWFSSENKDSESTRDLKITVKFLTNEIRSDALSVTIYKRRCIDVNSCQTSKIESNLNNEIKIQNLFLVYNIYIALTNEYQFRKV